jgi:putative salt-induced outer membrane protein YdiY
VSSRASIHRVSIALLLTAIATGVAEAQTPTPTPPPPPPLWLVSVGAGLAVTSGNSDTSTVNLAYEIKHDGGLPLVYRSTGLYLRGKSDEVLSVDKALLDNRLAWRFTERFSTFGQLGFLRDRLKEVDYLLSPGGGVSYALIKNDRIELSGDAGLGMIFEKNTDVDLETSGSVLGSQRLQYGLSKNARIIESVNAWWKMNDFDDSLYYFTVGVASSLTTNSQVTIDLLDTYKSRPTGVGVEKNDVSLIVSFVYKLTRQ